MNYESIIKNLLIASIQDRVHEAFRISQETCPVRDGGLKESGSVSDLPNGGELKYSAPYTSDVEEGVSERVEEVTRKTKTGFTTYQRRSPARQGTHFIANAMKNSFDNFDSIFDSKLRANFRVVFRN